MMHLKGLGGKKLSVLWKIAKIDSIVALLEACSNNVVSKIPGFGINIQQNIREAIEAYRSNEHRFHYANALVRVDMNPIFLLNTFSTDQRLPDSSGYPAEGLCVGLCGGVAADSRNCS